MPLMDLESYCNVLQVSLRDSLYASKEEKAYLEKEFDRVYELLSFADVVERYTQQT